MERSIETARRRRLHDADGPARPRHATIEPAEEGNGEPTRRKARPKRSAPPMRQYEGDYRAEAV